MPEAELSTFREARAVAVADAPAMKAPESLPAAIANLSQIYVHSFYAAYPHRGLWAGWPGCAGLAPDLSLGAFQRRVRALTDEQECLVIWRETLAYARAYVARSTSSWEPAATRQTLTVLTAQPPYGAPDSPETLARALAWASVELEALRDACAKELFNLRDWTYYADSPSAYIAAFDISQYLTRAFAPPAERLRALTTYLRHVPDLVAQIEERLTGPLPLNALTDARWAYHRLLIFYRDQAPTLGLALSDASAHDDGSRSAPTRDAICLPRAADERAYLAALDAATASLAQCIGWLDERATTAVPASRSALGEASLTNMLRVCLHEDSSLGDLLALGEADLEQNRRRADEAAAQLGLAGRPLPEAFATLDDWPQGVATRWTRKRMATIEQGALATARAIVEELRAFVIDRDLLPASFIDGSCLIDFQPSFLAGPFALLEAPGAFERADLPAWFYLPCAPKGVVARAVKGGQAARKSIADWRRGWQSRMTPWTLRNTTAHETIPGHYAFYRALRGIPSLAARAFRDYATVEGWAHYAEELVAEQGFGADDPRNALAMRRAAIHRDCRFLVTLRLHAGDLTLDEAVTLITGQTGLARTLGASEARRCLADPSSVGYTLGKLRLLRLREDYAEQEGANFTLRGFHEAVLALGQLPIPVIRRALLNEA